MDPWDLSDECAIGLARAALAAVLAVLGGRAVAGLLQGPRAAWAWAALGLLWLTPPILPGYAYAAVALGWSWGAEALYLALLTARGLPLAAAVLALGRPRIDDASRRCLALAGGWRASPRLWLRLQLGGPAGLALLAAGLVGLQAFCEFEWSSLLLIEGWSVRLFDAQVGGLPLGATLWGGALPLILQVVGVGALLLLALQGVGGAPVARRQGHGGWVVLGLAWVVLQVAPTLVLARTLATSPALARLPIAREIGASLIFAAAAVAVAWPLAGALRRGGLLLALPGLLGPLPLGLVVLAAFASGPLRLLLDTPLPLLLTHVLLLLPFAVLLRHALGRVDAASLTTVRMVGDAPSLGWRLAIGPRAAVCAALFALVYLELTASTLLAPSGMTPVFRRLYNQAHYGRSAGLSAMIALSLAAPLLLGLLGLATRRIWSRQWVRHWLEQA